MADDGVIKFNPGFTEDASPGHDEVALLNPWRRRHYELGLIGEAAGVGYGNVSMRVPPFEIRPSNRAFIVSGTQTGCFPVLADHHYATVIECYPDENRLNSFGQIKPSSESMTHGAIYMFDPNIRFAFHAHSANMWKYLGDRGFPGTDGAVEYGTPEMSAEVTRLLAAGDVLEERIFWMAGHEDGVFTFGRTAEEAWEPMFRIYELSKP